MNKEFIEKIKGFKEPLFYNSSGNSEAFKLFVRHLSFAPKLKLAKKEGKYIIPNDYLYIVDFENETINKVTDKIELVELKFYE